VLTCFLIEEKENKRGGKKFNRRLNTKRHLASVSLVDALLYASLAKMAIAPFL